MQSSITDSGVMEIDRIGLPNHRRVGTDCLELLCCMVNSCAASMSSMWLRIACKTKYGMLIQD